MIANVRIPKFRAVAQLYCMRNDMITGLIPLMANVRIPKSNSASPSVWLLYTYNTDMLVHKLQAEHLHYFKAAEAGIR